jgi:cytolethal distending toxin subunit A
MRAFGRCLASMVAAVAVFGSAGAAAGDPRGADQRDGARRNDELIQLGYQLVNLNSRKCLTVTAAGLADNAIIVQQDCAKDAAFRWRFIREGESGFYQIMNVNSGKCLAIAAAGIDDNAFATQYGCDHGPSQQWRLRKADDAGLLATLTPLGETLLENVHSQKCLTIAGGANTQNGVAVQYTCDDQQSRRWSMRLVAGATLQDR